MVRPSATFDTSKKLDRAMLKRMEEKRGGPNSANSSDSTQRFTNGVQSASKLLDAGVSLEEDLKFLSNID